jgi:uncharacterized membrane protein YkvA (DUF1232 family)
MTANRAVLFIDSCLSTNAYCHRERFSERSFWNKLRHLALKAGGEVVEKALWLYYAAQQPATPAWAKTVIYGALAYFILPLDAIPDFIPIAGYTDDLGALATALVTVSLDVTKDVKEQARVKTAQWFG